jgi:sulfur relay (sulfurtransferase) DsrF/TusC family protein
MDMKNKVSLHIIISSDPSTSFLFDIISNLEKHYKSINVIIIEPSDNSYKKSLELISTFSDNSNIMFLGHGTSEILYGGESEQFEKKVFISLQTMNIFKNQNIFILACNSATLLKSSFRLSQFNKSIGFGSLPTSPQEIENDKKLSKVGITDEIINLYKQDIVDIISNAFFNLLRGNINDFIALKDYIDLLLLKKINKAVLVDNKSLLADLLFKMKTEMEIY